jgi:hypothetical protein
MVGVRVLGYRKAGGGEGKGLGSREAGFDAGKGRGNMWKRCSGVLMAARVTWETVETGPGSD